MPIALTSTTEEAFHSIGRSSYRLFIAKFSDFWFLLCYVRFLTLETTARLVEEVSRQISCDKLLPTVNLSMLCSGGAVGISRILCIADHFKLPSTSRIPFVMHFCQTHVVSA